MKNISSNIRQLRRHRPINWFIRLNLLGIVGLVLVAWLDLNPQVADVFSPRRLANLKRFKTEIHPYPLRDQPFNVGEFWHWFFEIWKDKGSEAAKVTLSISIVAILLAGVSALPFAFIASRNVATPQPFLPSGAIPARRKILGWTLLRSATRCLFVLTRAIPEYIWAFLLISMLGLNAWPAILALALHNFGILGKLGAEVVENVDPAVPRALRAQGMSRLQISVFALYPMSFPKWLLFFFYRWETCIREAIVLGMLGISSLGYWVIETRAHDLYDEMLVFILIGALLVLIGDLISVVARRIVRRA